MTAAQQICSCSANEYVNSEIGSDTILTAAIRATLASIAAHLLVRLIEEDVVDIRRVLKVHGAVAQLQVVILTHPGSRSTSSLTSTSNQNNQTRK